MTSPVLLKLIGVLPLTSVKGRFNSRSVEGLSLSLKPITEGQIRLITSYSFGAPGMKKSIFLETK